MEICNTNECTGCSLCSSICPVGAISISDETGFYRPSIKNDKCIRCLKCQRECPANNRNKVEENLKQTPKVAYVAWDNIDEKHYLSASGGIASLLMKKVIDNGGFAVGVWFNPSSQRVEHRIFEKSDEIDLVRGSKYVNSKKNDIYKRVVELLKKKDGIFIGVPCEVYAMKSAVETAMCERRLVLVDLLCRGGASPRYFYEHIKRVGRNRRLDNVTFRGGKYDCQLCLYKNNKLIYKDGQFEDPYFRLFMRHTICQQACFECMFSGSKRIGDITLGDFWGLDEQIEKKSPVQGTNMVLLNTDEGKEVFSKILNQVHYEERPLLEAIKGNSTLQCATPKEEEYDAFWENIRQEGFYIATKKIYGIDAKKRFIKAKIKLEIKRVLGRV